MLSDALRLLFEWVVESWGWMAAIICLVVMMLIGFAMYQLMAP